MDNLFLSCLYPGPAEPKDRSTNMFFEPLVKELRELYKYGNLRHYRLLWDGYNKINKLHIFDCYIIIIFACYDTLLFDFFALLIFDF